MSTGRLATVTPASSLFSELISDDTYTAGVLEISNRCNNLHRLFFCPMVFVLCPFRLSRVVVFITREDCPMGVFWICFFEPLNPTCWCLSCIRFFLSVFSTSEQTKSWSSRCVVWCHGQFAVRVAVFAPPSPPSSSSSISPPWSLYGCACPPSSSVSCSGHACHLSVSCRLSDFSRWIEE